MFVASRARMCIDPPVLLNDRMGLFVLLFAPKSLVLYRFVWVWVSECGYRDGYYRVVCVCVCVCVWVRICILM